MTTIGNTIPAEQLESSENLEASACAYVEKSVKPLCKAKILPEERTAAEPQNLADAKATERTKKVYSLLKSFADSKKILYGHQNDLHRKVSKLYSMSDTYDIVRDYPAVVGLDALALTGYELELSEEEKKRGLTLCEKMAQICLEADRQGAVLTMSCHMPNFALVAKRPKIEGKYDFSGYSPLMITGDVAARILPGGDLNAVYLAYLSLVAELLEKLAQSDVPVVFRPLHENTGDWFWWGAKSCTAQQFRELFCYTVSCLRDEKHLHNLLYAYSPGGGELHCREDYEERYPGDAYVDITGFDMYHREPRPDDGFLQGEFRHVLQLVEDFAGQHGKIAAVTETGMLVGSSAMAKSGSQYKTWFSDAGRLMAGHRMAWFLTWSNFDETNFDQPYMLTETHGQELINEFIRFYNEPWAVFAHQLLR